MNYLSEFEQLKDQIPEFIVKLYHILESKEYDQYICWFGQTEILIKNGKKLQEKVLPHFFRHKHLSSFIRQLNMYKFNKVNKLTKEKNHMYFKNQNFKRSVIADMTKIKRNSKKKQRQETEQQDQQVSIDQQLQQNNFESYKELVKNSAKDILQSLKQLENSHPQLKSQLQNPIALCERLTQQRFSPPQISEEIVPIMNPQMNMSYSMDESLQNKNMLSTMRLLPRLDTLIFPSQYSFYHFN